MDLQEKAKLDADIHEAACWVERCCDLSADDPPEILNAAAEDCIYKAASMWHVTSMSIRARLVSIQADRLIGSLPRKMRRKCGG